MKSLNKFLLVSLYLSVSAIVCAGADDLVGVIPLVKYPDSRGFNEYGEQKTIGPKEFYFAAMPFGYGYGNEKYRKLLMEVGLLDLITPPQMIGLNCFDPSNDAKLVSHEKYVRDFILKNRYPFGGINYSHVSDYMKRPPITEECFKNADELLIQNIG